MKNSHHSHRILIVTQKVDINDPILGFFHGWVIELAKKFEKVTVICLEKGEYKLPENVRVYSLGKEQFENSNIENSLKIKNYKLKIFRRLKYIINFYKYIWRERKNYDAVFVHMNQEYVILGGIFWRLFRKKILLWYIHPKSNIYLQFSIIFAHKILSATKLTFPMLSKKVVAVGHGIDTDKFKRDKNLNINKEKNSILFVGRISKIKNIEVFIQALKILDKDDLPFKAYIVGGVDPNQVRYLLMLKKQSKDLEEKGKIEFLGEMSRDRLIALYQKSDLLVNLTKTGSFDKVVLEAVLCGMMVLVSNKAFEGLLSEKCLCDDLDPLRLASNMKNALVLEEVRRCEIIESNISKVEKKHSLKFLPEKIIKIINETSK